MKTKMGVLWQLCDRFQDGNPDNGCFPSQETLLDLEPIARCALVRTSISMRWKVPA
jgi:hypothetical protein